MKRWIALSLAATLAGATAVPALAAGIAKEATAALDGSQTLYFAPDRASEQFVLLTPPDFKEVGATEHDAGHTFEYRPGNETGDDWTRSVTYSLFHKGPDTLKGHYQHFVDFAKGSCSELDSGDPAFNEQNGYATMIFTLSCQPASGPREKHLYKVQKGTMGMHVVQVRWRGELKTAEQDYWALVATMSKACDARSDNRRCRVE